MIFSDVNVQMIHGTLVWFEIKDWNDSPYYEKVLPFRHVSAKRKSLLKHKQVSIIIVKSFTDHKFFMHNQRHDFVCCCMDVFVSHSVKYGSKN